MKNRLTALKEYLNTHLLTIAPVALIVMLAIGCIVFYVSSIAPELNRQAQLSAQLNDALKQQDASRSLQGESPQSLQTRIAKAQATTTNSLNVFLTSDQANRVVDALYQYAHASGATIIDFQTPMTPTPLPTPIPTQTPPPTLPPPSPTGSGSAPSSNQPNPTIAPTYAIPTRTPIVSSVSQSNLYTIRTLRLTAQGTSRQLVDFASRIQELTKNGIVVTSFNITGNEATTGASLTMDISLYVYVGSPIAPLSAK